MSISDLFNNDQLDLSTAFSVPQILLSFTLTFLTALFIYWVYRKTYNGVLYSKNFNTTLVMIALVANAIIIALSGNLILSLGLVGALSIVRFRTAIKDPKDTAFLFWSLTMGIVNGVAYYELALISSVFIATAVSVLSKGSVYEPSYMMIVNFEPGTYPQIESVLDDRFKRHHLRSDSQAADSIERVIEIRLKAGELDAGLQELRGIPGVQNCLVLSSSGDFAE